MIAPPCAACGDPAGLTMFYGHCPSCFGNLSPEARNEVRRASGAAFEAMEGNGVQAGLEMSDAEKLRIVGHLARVHPADDPKASVGDFSR